MLKLFLTFLKINSLCTSGPASIGLTKELVVPELISPEKFSQITAITCGIPGSDAIQMAFQIGYAYRGLLGAVVSVIGALIPTILFLGVAYFSLHFIDQKLMTKFFNGVNPALAILLFFTAISLIKPNGGSVQLLVLFSAALMLYFKLPVALVLIVGGVLGVILL